MNRLFPLLAVCATLLLPPVSLASEPEDETPDDAVITLVGLDFPDYEEVVGQVRLPGIDPAVLEETDPQYLRLSLADKQAVPFLPDGMLVYQTVSTGTILPVHVNIVVDAKGQGYCFNPEIPYCTDFDKLNEWFRRSSIRIENKEEAGNLARFVVELGMSTVHHPKNFLFFRLTQDFPLQHWSYLKDIEFIYEKNYARYRSEEEAEEYERITSKYRDRINRVTIEEIEGGYRLHGFTYKMMSAAGDLREWTVVVRPRGLVEVEMETLETGIGEVSWSWAR